MTGPPGPDAADLRLRLLVLRAQAGDERAFGELFERFGRRTLAYLRGLVGGDAEDLQQEVWLTVYRRLAGLVDPGAFRPWLFRATRHRAIDHLRARRRERELLVDGADLDRLPAPAEPEVGSLDPADLERGLERLTPLAREVLLLRYQDGMSYAELALVAGVPIGTIRSRLHAARERLRALLDHPQPGRPKAGAPATRGDS